MAPQDDDEPATRWQTVVFYPVYSRSFQDGDGDGVGDLEGITRSVVLERA